MLKSVTLEVTGEQRLNCEKCEQRVTRLLTTLQGVRQVRARALDQRIEVLFDTTKVEPAALAKCLGDVGYETRVVN
ncbi:heavy-metal-associated domain-containing protein [Cupriavidus sp. SK-3]|uniref:heavy-metal-associated domain-containing protein n=1 Tax=Cupriavidus sp. SK-3 TaxID=1470558 RepID=UPI0009DD3FE1|nr:heavy-metal-associated domain-containing protein [Cupriavidus sp. SK-3]